MALHQAEPAYLVSGQFSGGTITVNDPGAHCTDQVYTVDGAPEMCRWPGPGTSWPP